MIYLQALLLLPLALAGTVVSNIPVIVSEYKNYTTSDPKWLTSPFFRAGYEDVIKVFTGSNVPSTDYTFTFSSALPGIPNLAYGIKNYRGNDYFGQEFYEIKKIGLTAATFSVSIQIFGITNLWKLSVAYIAVDPTFPHHLNTFDNVPINATGGDIVNISKQTSSLNYYVQQINYTWQTEGRTFRQFTNPLSSNKIVLFMTSLWIRGTSGIPVKLHCYTDILNSTFYKWNVTLQRMVLVTNVHFSEIIFNSDDVQSSEKYFIVYKLWYNDMNGGFIDIPQEFVDNFIMGITTFEAIKSNCGFEYQWQYATKTIDGKSVFGVEILYSWTLTNTCGLSWSETSIFYMMTWKCEEPYSYFNLTSGLCQTVCGGFYYENETALVCAPCTNKDCYLCETANKSLCTECATYLYFELVDGECVCMFGYLHANSSCMLCSDANTGCYNCSYDDGAKGTLAYDSSKFSCLECNKTANYFLTGSLCTKCTLTQCLYCQNLTACSVCNSGYNLSSIHTCILCYVTGCLYCSTTNPNVCATCHEAIGYYANTANQKCKTICGDGIYVSASEGCDDGNLDSYDGCSSTCTVESSFTCSGSPSACYFAAAQSLTIDSQAMESAVCNTITFGFRFSPASATFAQPFVNWTSFLSTPNESILVLNSSMFKYEAGVLSVSFFLLAHLQNQTLIFDTNFSSLIENSSIFVNTTAPRIEFEVSTTPEALMVCCEGFFMNYEKIRCDEICGDGIVFNLACDDGNLNNGDGCSSICTIEKDYSCMNGTETTPSICSYNGSFSVSLETGDKSPSSNSLTLTYNIEPSGPLLSLNNGSTDFSSLVSFPNSQGVTIKSAVLDPQTQQLVVVIDYSQNLQDTTLSLQITPPNVPQAVLVPNITSSWVVAPTNQLAAMVYTQEDYDTVAKLTPLANALLGSYLSIVILSLVFRKFIGLELATFFQIGYLSLLQNAKISTYSQPIASWSQVFGYNDYFLSPLPKQRFVSPYALYGYHRYFGFSNNLMVIVAASVFGVALLLLGLSILVGRGSSRRLKHAAYLAASEVGYALMVFSTPNIVTAICIEAREGVLFSTEQLWSKAFLITACCLLLTTHILQLSTAEQFSDVGTFLRKHSKLAIYMPIAFSARLIVLTVLLYVYHFTQDLPQYLIIIAQVGYVLLVVFGRPHKKPYDFFRSLCLEIGILYLLLMRFAEVNLLSEYASSDTSLYSTLAYLEYSFYGLGSTVSLISLIYHFVKVVRGSKKVSDPELVEVSPDIKISNESTAKIETSPTKRKVSENALIFDMEEMEAEIPHTSQMSLDTKATSRKVRGRKNRVR